MFFSSTKQTITLPFRTFNPFFRCWGETSTNGNIFQLLEPPWLSVTGWGLAESCPGELDFCKSCRSEDLSVKTWMAIPTNNGSGCCFPTQKMDVFFFPTSQLQDLVVSSLLVFAPHNWFLSCSLQVFIPNIEIETCFFQLWRGSSLYVFSINCRERERERERERLTWLTKVATGIRPCSTSHKWLWRFFRNRCLNLSLHQHTSNTHQYLLYAVMKKSHRWWQKTWQVLHGSWMYKLYLKRPSCALK